MDEALTGDQAVLLEASERFASTEHPLTKLRERAHDDPEVAATYRHQAAELGWFALLVPEADGGGSISGNGVVDAALVAYTRGRLLQPGAFVGTNVVARAIAGHGTPAQRADVLPTLVGGDADAAWVIGDAAGAPARAGAVDATAAGDGWSLTGTAAMVPVTDASAWLLVSAATPAGPTQLLVAPGTPGLTVTPLDALDVSRRFAEVRFDGAVVPASAAVGGVGDGALVDELLALACVLTAAEGVGAMHQEFEMTVDYAKQRIAFGRPIGSFQAIKHLLADTSAMLEVSKAVVLAAATQAGEGDAHAVQAASQAKAFVSDAGLDHVQACFQVFGGISFTWEHDQHLYFRRITTDAELYGDAAWHREHICRLAGIGEAS